MRAPRIGLAAAFALSASMSFTTAEAAEPGPDTLPIHVIAIQTPDADDQAEALTKALRNAVRAMPGWSQGEGDYSLEVLTLSLKCPDPPDAGCQSRIADQIRADRYIWGVLSKGKNGNVVGEVNFWVRNKGTQAYKLNYSANLTESQEEALKKVATDAFTSLSGGPPKGEVKVKAGSVAGQVFIDGEPQGALTNGEGTFLVPAGPHELVVKAPGYGDMSTPITVKPNSPTDVVVAPQKEGDKTPINWKRIGGFAAVGAGAAFGVVGVYHSLQVSEYQKRFDPYQQRYTSDKNLCNLANGVGVDQPVAGSPLTAAEKTDVKNICSGADTSRLLQIVFYPLAAVAAGAGVFLLATSGSTKEKPKAGLMILPQFDRHGGKVDVGFRF